VSRNLKPAKQTVELRASRIRRDPALVAKPAEADKKLQWQSSEREIKIAIIGIVLFALAIDIIIIAIGAYWS
jgi:hypothetical protein